MRSYENHVFETCASQQLSNATSDQSYYHDQNYKCFVRIVPVTSSGSPVSWIAIGHQASQPFMWFLTNAVMRTVTQLTDSILNMIAWRSPAWQAYSCDAIAARQGLVWGAAPFTDDVSANQTISRKQYRHANGSLSCGCSRAICFELTTMILSEGCQHLAHHVQNDVGSSLYVVNNNTCDERQRAL